MRTEKRTTQTIYLDKADIEVLAKKNGLAGRVTDGEFDYDIRFAETITLTFSEVVKTGN